MKISPVWLSIGAATMIVSTTGASDFNFGSNARSVAMGGAGLALTDDASTSSIVNPAAAAAGGARFRFIMPSVDFHTRGASFGDIRNRTNEISSGDSNDALQLAKDFGSATTTLAAGGVAGFSGGLGITAEGEAEGLINPGETFKEWVSAGMPSTPADLLTAISTGKLSDATVVAAIGALANGGTPADVANVLTQGTNVQAKWIYSVPSINWGTGFNQGNSGNKLWVGTRMRWLNSEVHTWSVQQKSDVSNNIDLEAVETQNEKDSGFGADLGVIYQPKGSIAQWGMVINNIVDAKLKGIQTPRMLSVGMASQPRANLRYAIDLVNINKAYNENTRLRMGAELTVGRGLALRAGNSGDGWTYGVGVMGMNFAFSSDAPNMISRILRF